MFTYEAFKDWYFLFVKAFSEIIHLAHLPESRLEKIIHLAMLFIYWGFTAYDQRQHLNVLVDANAQVRKWFQEKRSLPESK